MSDDATGQAQGDGLTIPAEVQKKFGPLLELIKGSESMNNEERQYWINILPIMTPEQIQNLENILQNEKKQLAAIDKKYEKTISEEEQNTLLAAMEKERSKKRKERSSKESQIEQKEQEAEKALLEEIENL